MRIDPNPGPVLATKLHPPGLPQDLIPRAKVRKALEAARTRPLTLICAPPGYGKTMLLASWVTSSSWTWAWLSLDEEDSDLAVFLEGLLAALGNRVPPPEAASLRRASVVADLSGSDLARDFVQVLSSVDEDFLLVLDDYHLIHDTRIHDFLARILHRPPRALHLVLGTRHDPPLDLGRYRARGEISEMRLEALRFTEEESTRFLGKAVRARLPDAVVSTAHAQTEGWAAGLRLAALSLAQTSDPGQWASSHAPGRHLRQYLFQEVLQSQPPEERRALLLLSIPDRFCSSLLRALGGHDSSILLKRIVEKNLLIVALDDQGGWYRFHHLFREFLRKQLSVEHEPEAVRAIHACASDWFREHDLPEEAIRHALRAENPSKGAEVIRRYRQDVMNREEWNRLDRWLASIPSEFVHRDPELLVSLALLQETRFQYPEMLKTIARIESVLTGDARQTELEPVFRAELHTLQSIAAYLNADVERAVALAGEALCRIAPESLSTRGIALAVHSMALQMAGKSKEGVSTTLQSLRDRSIRGTTLHTRGLITLCLLHWMEGDLKQLVQVASELESMGKENRLEESVAFARYFLGIGHLDTNDPLAAEAVLLPVTEDLHPANVQNHAHSLLALALAFLDLGKPERARDVLTGLSRLALKAQNPEMLQLAEGFEAELELRMGEVRAAVRWVERFTPSPKPTRWRYFMPELTAVKVLLAEDTQRGLQQAEKLLQVLQDHAEVTHGRRSLIDILGMRAVLLELRGEPGSASEVARRALDFAEPGRVIRPLLDLGPAMGKVLARGAKEGTLPGFAGKVLAAFRERATQDTALPIGEVSGALGAPVGLEPLTERESQVLALLSERLSDKEIAEKLLIAPGTVKKHLNSIYGKLAVHDRVEVVTKARDLQLLPSSPARNG